MMTDPIADMLTRIRNGLSAKFEAVDIPSSRMKLEIARILKAEGYIKNYKLTPDEKQGVLKVFLKYGDDKRGTIVEIKRVSKPGRRVYAPTDEIPVIKNGLGISILSTSKGVMSDKDARQEKVGGEIICTVW